MQAVESPYNWFDLPTYATPLHYVNKMALIHADIYEPYYVTL